MEVWKVKINREMEERTGGIEEKEEINREMEEWTRGTREQEKKSPQEWRNERKDKQRNRGMEEEKEEIKLKRS